MKFRVRELVVSAKEIAKGSVQALGIDENDYSMKCSTVRYKKNNILYSKRMKVIVCNVRVTNVSEKKIITLSFVGNLDTGDVHELRRVV